MDFEKIVKKLRSNSESKKNHFRSWLLSVESSLNEKNIVDVLSDEKQIVQLFFLKELSGVSQQQYNKTKRYIQVLLDFFEVNSNIPSREEILSSHEVTYLYKDLKSLINLIDDVGKSHVINYDPDCDLLNVKAIAILGWHGLSLGDIASLPKGCLSKEEGKYFVHGIQIDEHSFKLLENLSKSTGHKGLPLGKIQYYRGCDDYLFRSIKADTKINEKHLSDYLRCFNVLSAKIDRCIIFRQLHKNALFVAIRDGDKSNDKLSEKIYRAFKCNIKNTYGLAREYNQWMRDTT